MNVCTIVSIQVRQMTAYVHQSHPTQSVSGTWEGSIQLSQSEGEGSIQLSQSVVQAGKVPSNSVSQWYSQWKVPSNSVSQWYWEGSIQLGQSVVHGTDSPSSHSHFFMPRLGGEMVRPYTYTFQFPFPKVPRKSHIRAFCQ